MTLNKHPKRVYVRAQYKINFVHVQYDSNYKK